MDDLHKLHHDFHDGHISDIYQHSRIEEPPISLDSAVLTHARQAISKTTRRPFWKRISWLVPVSSTAMILITASLIMQTTQQYKAVLPDASTMQKSPSISDDSTIDSAHPTIKAKQLPSIVEDKTQRMESLQGNSLKATSSLRVKKEPNKRREVLATEQYLIQAEQGTPITIQEKRLEAEFTNHSETLGIKASLKQIRKLIQQKDFLKANDYLIALQKAHPDFMIPNDIRENLK